MKTKVTLKFAIVCIIGALAFFLIAMPIFSLLMSGKYFQAFILAFAIFALIGFGLSAVFNFILKFVCTEEMKKMAQWYAGRYEASWIPTIFKLKRDKQFFLEVFVLMQHEGLIADNIFPNYAALKEAVASNEAVRIKDIIGCFQDNITRYEANDNKTKRDACDEILANGPEAFVEKYPSLRFSTLKSKK